MNGASKNIEDFMVAVWTKRSEKHTRNGFPHLPDALEFFYLPFTAGNVFRPKSGMAPYSVVGVCLSDGRKFTYGLPPQGGTLLHVEAWLEGLADGLTAPPT